MNTDKHRFKKSTHFQGVKPTKKNHFSFSAFKYLCSSVCRPSFEKFSRRAVLPPMIRTRIMNQGVFICGKTRFFFGVLLSVVALSLSSCAEVAKDMGLDEVPDFEQRAGLAGTQDNPAVLDPFKKYNLVMAANECRFFTMKVPERWYSKINFTHA